MLADEVFACPATLPRLIYHQERNATKHFSKPQTLMSELRRSLKVMVFQRRLQEAAVGDPWVKFEH